MIAETETYDEEANDSWIFLLKFWNFQYNFFNYSENHVQNQKSSWKSYAVFLAIIWLLEIETFTKLAFILLRSRYSLYLLVCHIDIVRKNPNLMIYFWYAHTWHEIRIFQETVICAWWVISNRLYIIRDEKVLFESLENH